MGGRGSGRKVDGRRRRRMARLRDRGLTLEEIGRQLGVTKQCVQATLAKAGPPPRPITCRECGAVVVAAPSGNRRPLPALCLGCLARLPGSPFADRLRAFRLAAGLTQAEVAERAGLTRRRLSSVERGDGLADWPEMVALAR